MAVVLAIEPDLRQAAILKRIVKEKVKADIVVVDSRDAALDAIGRGVPDVLLLSALMSPRDEDELIHHLRSLEGVDHLQTHTIPQLSSSLEDSAPSKARGLLKAFRRKKEPAAHAAGCDPDLFAEEIRTYVKYASDKKEERRALIESGRLAASSAPRVTASAHEAPVAAGAPASSWNDPFAWNPVPAMPAPPAPAPEPGIAEAQAVEAAPDPWATDYRPARIIAASPDELPPADSHLAAQPESEVEAPEPVIVAEPEIDAPVLTTAADAEPEIVREIETEPEIEQPVVAATSSTVEEPPVVEPAAAEEPVAVASTREPVIVMAAGREASVLTPEREPESIAEPEPEPLPVLPRSLGPLATWVRFEVTVPNDTTKTTNDELRALMAHLAIPPQVAGVTYARGCRIRRVRVPGGRERRKGRVPGPVILSRRQLAAQREGNL